MAQVQPRSFPQRRQSEVKTTGFLPDLFSGLIMGLSEVILAISLGSLVFSGELTTYLSQGIGIVLFTAAIIMIVTSLLSRVPGVIGSIQDTSSVMLAVIAAGLVGSLSGASPQDRLVTVIVGMAAATLLTGFFFIALGSFKLGGLVRYIPYPVIGGFLAGTGWLLVQGSFSVMTGLPLQLANVPALLQPDQLILWIPGIIFALMVFFGLRHFKHVLVLPGILVGGVIVFHVVLLAMGISSGEAIQKGFLPGQISTGAIWKPLLPGDLLTANWTAILGQSANVGILLILSLVGFLLNASALELAIRDDIDLNRELLAAGFANLVSGLGGGMVGYPALSLSTLSYKIGARDRLAGLVAGAVCLAMLFAGMAILALFPKPVLGGLLFFLGMDFLVEWLVSGWRKLSRADYAIVWLILVLIAATNFLIGVAAGMAATIVLFLWSYSRINVVYHAFSGAELRSNVERCTYHRQALAEMGRDIYILELQGFIFFGTANSLLERIRARAVDAELPKVHFILLDFRRVSGLDSSAGLSFTKAKQIAEAQGITLVLTHVSGKILHQLELDPSPGSSRPDSQAGGVRIFPDLDRGLEWCEDQLLDLHMVTGLHTPIALVAQLADSGFEKSNTVQLKEYLKRVVFQKGDTLICQGDEANALYFIELGSVSVFLETENGERVRLQTFGLGTAVGELDLYQGGAYTASVIADSQGTAYRLTQTALSEMKKRDPELYATFHEFITHLLAERLAATTRTLEAAIR